MASLAKRLRRLESLVDSGVDYQFHVKQASTGEELFSVGRGRPHEILVADSQMEYLRWMGSCASSPDGIGLALVIGDRHAGSTWAGLISLVTLALATGEESCVYVSKHELDYVHATLRRLLPPAWAPEEAEEDGHYRLGQGSNLFVASWLREKTWRPGAAIVMVSDYASATQTRAENAIRHAASAIICGNPPHEQREEWITKYRDAVRRHPDDAHLFRLRSDDNQFINHSRDIRPLIEAVDRGYFRREDAFFEQAEPGSR